MMRKFSDSGIGWLLLSLVVIGLDHYSKTAILTRFELNEVLPVTDFFNLTLAYNKGAAFSFLSAASGWQVWIFGGLAVVISGVLTIWLRKISCHQWWLAVAISLIIGGALGNLWDRLDYGYVIDFLQFHLGRLYYPVFNLADSSICVGALMLVVDSLRAKRQPLP